MKFAKDASGYLGAVPSEPTYDVMMFDDTPCRIHRVLVYHKIVADPYDDYRVGQEELRKIGESERMQWILKHAIESPQWHRHLDPATYSHVFTVSAKLKDPDYVIWQLKFC